MNEWQPIETAPKDGTKVLLFVDTGYEARIHPGKWNDDRYAKRPRPYWDYLYFQTMDSRDHQPTHWMPLPAPPKGEQS